MAENNTPNVTTDQELIVKFSPYYAAFFGSRAMIESEGVIPKDTDWPTGYDKLHWQSGLFDFTLRRQRPEGARGARRQFIDCDWWCLWWDLTNQPSFAEWEVQRKARELADTIYAHSAQGRAQSDVLWERYWQARRDKPFQSFKDAIPGLAPTKRGHRATQQGAAT